MPIDDRQIRDYLLGSLAESDEEEISLHVIADEDFSERLDQAEHELVEDHLDGLLSEREQKLFRENFLTSPARRALIQEVDLLRSGLHKISPIQASAAGRVQKAPKQKLFSFFSRPVLAGFGLLIALAAAFTVWFSFLRDPRTPLEVEYAYLNRHDLGDPAKTATLYTISIIPANFRDNASTASHPASKLTGSVVLRLALLDPEPEGAERQVSLERSGKRIFKVTARVFRNAFGSELRAMVPKEVLAPGNYEIHAPASDERYSPATYQLRIE